MNTAWLLFQAVCCFASAIGQESTRVPSLEEVESGMCDRYTGLRALRVKFREEFTYYSQDREGAAWRGRPVVADATWTVELREDVPVARARERLEVEFLEGAGVFVHGPGALSSGSAVFVWDGEKGTRLGQYVTAAEKRRGSLGFIQNGKSAERGELEIESFLFFWHQHENIEQLSKALSDPEEPKRVVGMETVSGVPCVVVEHNSRRYDLRWRMALAHRHDFVLMRLQVWSPRDEKKPYAWIEVEKIRRFGDVWFPVEGEYVTKRSMSQRYWEHRFVIEDIRAGEPFDVSVLDVDWPPNTTVFDIPAKIQYRTTQAGGIPERTEALDRALALARASRPPPVSGGPGTTTILAFVLGALVVAGAGWWGWRIRRRHV